MWRLYVATAKIDEGCYMDPQRLQTASNDNAANAKTNNHGRGTAGGRGKDGRTRKAFTG